MQKYPTVSLKNGSLKNFIAFWGGVDSPYDESVYSDLIHKKKFTGDDIVKLFTWKSGGTLNQKEKASVKKIVNKLDVVNKLKQKYDAEVFGDNFSSMPASWFFFLMHIIIPKRCPRFDQYVHLARQYLDTKKVIELPDNDNVLKMVSVTYFGFFNALTKKGYSPDDLDRALRAFGMYIKSEFATPLLSTAKN